MVSTAWAVLAATLFMPPAPESAAGSWKVTVRSRGGALGEVPLVAPVPDGLNVPAGDYDLKPEGGGPALPAQVFGSQIATVLRGLPAGARLTYTLTPQNSSSRAGRGVEIRPLSEGSGLDVAVGGKPLTAYRTDLGTKPVLYPVIGPTGEPFTRAYPMKKDVAGEDRDHPHQRSLWFTHGNVNGLDFWASDPLNRPTGKSGSIKETSREVVSGPVFGQIRTTDDWLGPDGKRVCSDARVVRFYDTAGGRVFDFDVTVKATDGAVTFGDTKEGTFGIRVASSMDVTHKQGGKITNAEGVTDDKAWGKASPWVDYTGPVAGKTVGIAILNHPESVRYPTTWHVRTYGLFAANPFGWHDFGRKESGELTVPPGQWVRFLYRVILHEGDTESARIADAFRAYSEPPSVEIKAE